LFERVECEDEVTSPKEKEFLVVGVTGGIGVGKTAVCDLFAEIGRTVISADVIARELTEKDESIRRQIQAAFGKAIYERDGALNRSELAKVVFASPHKRRKLNAIVHPSVFEEIDERINSMPLEQRRPYLLIEAALIYETGMDKRLDYVIAVDAADETRIGRVMQRDGVSRDQVMGRIQSQMPPDRKLARADFVIENNSSADSLRAKVSFLDSLLAMLICAPGTE
jgi:dephospho-CoA kinase